MNTFIAVPVAVKATPSLANTHQAGPKEADASENSKSFAHMLDDTDASAPASNESTNAGSNAGSDAGSTTDASASAADTETAEKTTDDKDDKSAPADTAHTAGNDILAQLNIAAAILPVATSAAVASTPLAEGVAETKKATPALAAAQATPAAAAQITAAEPGATAATRVTPATQAISAVTAKQATLVTPAQATPAMPVAADKIGAAAQPVPDAEASIAALALAAESPLSAAPGTKMPTPSKVLALATAVSTANTSAPSQTSALPVALALALGMQSSTGNDSGGFTDNKEAPGFGVLALATEAATMLAPATVAASVSGDAMSVNAVTSSSTSFPPELAAPVRASGLLASPDKTLVMQTQEESSFAEAIGNRMVWQAGERIGRAEISLSPSGMGPLTVTLHMDGNKVRADFSSAQPEVRAALESNIPRLREMLAGQGLQLAHAGVGSGNDNASRNPEFDREARLNNQNNDFHEEAIARISPAEARQNLRRGILDEYA